jgi:hypothetical protein
MPSNGSDAVFPDNLRDCHKVIAELRKKLETAEQSLKEQQKLCRRAVEDLVNCRKRLKDS